MYKPVAFEALLIIRTASSNLSVKRGKIDCQRLWRDEVDQGKIRSCSFCFCPHVLFFINSVSFDLRKRCIIDLSCNKDKPILVSLSFV